MGYNPFPQIESQCAEQTSLFATYLYEVDYTVETILCGSTLFTMSQVSTSGLAILCTTLIRSVDG